jgi:hypothetical protein
VFHTVVQLIYLVVYLLSYYFMETAKFWLRRKLGRVHFFIYVGQVAERCSRERERERGGVEGNILAR